MEEEEATDSRRERTRTMVVVGRIESVMADGRLVRFMCVFWGVCFRSSVLLGSLSPTTEKNNALIILDRPILTKARKAT